MDSWEWNKIAGAVLGTLIFVMAVKIATEAIYDVEPPAKPGYVVEGVAETPASGAAAAPVEEAVPDWGTVLASADVKAGAEVHKRCEQCHDISKGGPNKIGPELWGVEFRPRASHPGFSYSGAMKAKGGTWTYDELFRFLKSPGGYIPGTKMSFAGIKSIQDRINLIAFLRTQSNSPPPIPAPAAAKPAQTAPAAAPAAGDKSAGHGQPAAPAPKTP